MDPKLKGIPKEAPGGKGLSDNESNKRSEEGRLRVDKDVKGNYKFSDFWVMGVLLLRTWGLLY